MSPAKYRTRAELVSTASARETPGTPGALVITMSSADDWPEAPLPIDRRNSSEAVFEHMRSAIETGRLGVGTRLPSENALAKRYGVSRTVVREVLRSMATLGFTTTRVGSGTYVIASAPGANPAYGEYTARDLLEARPAIEVPAATLAATRRSAEQLRELQVLCLRMEEEPDPVAWVELDSQFHCEIARASGNRIFGHVVHDIRDALTQQSQLIGALTRRRARIKDSNAEHRAVVDAIAAGSPDEAGRAMQAHLDRVETIMSAVMNSPEAPR
jgi:DNA-binding FadR family transcriptional regulator